MRIKDRGKFPPGMWKFHQPQTGWWAQIGLTFNQVVDAIIDHRRSNPRFSLPTDKPTVERELEQYTIARLQTIRGGDQWLVSDDLGGQVPKAYGLPLRPPSRGASVAEGVKRKAVGIRVIMDWLGAGGKPVTQDKADQRAETCSACPINVDMNLVDRLTGAAAEMLHKQIEAKANMNLRTSKDGNLKVCGGCDCKLDLKVWTPIDHIAKEMSEEAISRLDVGCWVLSEMKP